MATEPASTFFTPKVLGILSIVVAIGAPLVAVLQQDARYAFWGALAAAAINGLGNVVSRYAKQSDQQAGVRPPATGVDPTPADKLASSGSFDDYRHKS